MLKVKKNNCPCLTKVNFACDKELSPNYSLILFYYLV